MNLEKAKKADLTNLPNFALPLHLWIAQNTGESCLVYGTGGQRGSGSLQAADCFHFWFKRAERRGRIDFESQSLGF